jgi:hypothetical protein
MIKVVENFLPTAIFKRIKYTVEGTNFQWRRFENFAGSAVKIPPYKVVDGFSNIVNVREDITTGIFLPLIDCIADELNTTPHSIMRAHVNLTTPQYGWSTGDLGYPHIDDTEPHIVALYYLDDADGGTTLYNEFGPNTPQSFTMHKIVNPEPNKLVLFNGLRFHSANPPLTRRKRIIVNLNFRDTGALNA